MWPAGASAFVPAPGPGWEVLGQVLVSCFDPQQCPVDRGTSRARRPRPEGPKATGGSAGDCTPRGMEPDPSERFGLSFRPSVVTARWASSRWPQTVEPTAGPGQMLPKSFAPGKVIHLCNARSSPGIYLCAFVHLSTCHASRQMSGHLSGFVGAR